MHQHLAHSARFKLKNAHCIPITYHTVGLFIVKRNTLHREGGVAFAYFPLCVCNDGEITDAQKVKFYKAKLGNGIHIVFRYGDVAVLRKRHVVANRIGRDNHACRMR